ncbi:CWC16 protein [Aspergillus cavernicola]|uniref:CWC16 protein n=1 Tax=Aspergillus cavernicola TaxID=176166 RepID=A0ABR4IHI1_9EURO
MQGFNMGRYVPPDLEGLTTGNALSAKHPLGSRARHLKTKGALIVRFEMPFATWCTTCKPENIIGQGVRFNAEKKKVGQYYSTPVYSFRFRHTVCGGWIEVRTDPRNTAYVVVEGGRRRDYGDDDGEKGNGVVGEIKVGNSLAGAGGAGDDPFAKIEGKVEDKRVVDEARIRILELQRRQDRDWDDPYELSRRLRKGFRAERKGLEKKEAGREALKEKMSLGIEIVDENEEDAVRAAMVDFDGEVVARGTRTRGLFETASTRGTGHGSSSSSGADKMKGKGGKRRAADLVAERKTLFRSELSGNTRAAIDPFLKDTNVWEPEVKKRKALGKAEGKKETTPSDAVQETKETGKSQGTSAALVDYGSDSD